MDQVEFTQALTSKVEGELLIPFEDLNLHLAPYDKTATNRLAPISEKQLMLVNWAKEIPGCNWSIGFIDDDERQIMVVKWWFGISAGGNPPVEEPAE
jgi:hypothetical protein